MSTLLPQATLDSLLCHFCHKFLSVTPIKELPDGKIQCGRCVAEENDNYRISLYNEVAIRNVFKCINQYEGCKAILNSTEVVEHEKTCKSKKYVCPACKESVPSYLIYNHFTSRHEELVLKQPSFVVKQSNYTNQTFFYRYKTYLLFVKYAHAKLFSNNQTTAVFNFSLVGDPETVKTLKVNLALVFSETKMEMKVNCDAYPSRGESDLRIDLKENMFVIFSLEIPKSDVTEQKIVIATNQEHLQNLRSQYSSLLLNFHLKKREIYLDDEYKRLISNGVILEKDEKEFKVKIYEVTFNCLMCSLPRSVPDFFGNSIYYKISGIYYNICNTCSVTFEDESNRYYLNDICNLSFFCKWMCGTHVHYSKLQEHEFNCENQVPQQCPVESCEHSCKSFEIQQHKYSTHPEFYMSVFIFDNYLWPCQTLRQSLSPIKVLYVVSNINIVIEFVWDAPFWKISLSCKIPNSKPRMIICNNGELYTNFVTFIKGNGSCRHLNEICYRCYLADPESEEFEKRIKKYLR